MKGSDIPSEKDQAGFPTLSQIGPVEETGTKIALKDPSGSGMSEEKGINENDSRRTEKADFPTLSYMDPVVEIGTQIGPYKILNIMGEGGFGIVYKAGQKEPVRRQVALKVIRPDRDSKKVIARFDFERQILASLDHPNIARVYDAGVTETGRSYFVMELVREGQPITEYCDQQRFNISERLNIFRQVCHGIQHAHQKGIIHRDIKPSNVLVPRVITSGDDDSIPKIIDFGVAKAINQPVTERTLFTKQGQIIGTPEYMSPEQTGKIIHGIDTRSDIYSLGVLLYELLTGVLPFDFKMLRQGSFDEMLRVICEDEPPRLSERVSSLGDEAKKIADRRFTKPAALTKELQKELEWIALKAMKKEPNNRYKTVSELVEDVLNYQWHNQLTAGFEPRSHQRSGQDAFDELFGIFIDKPHNRHKTLSEIQEDIVNYMLHKPLIAGPESRTYRARKFVRRHAGLILLVVALIFSTLLAGLFGMLYFLEKARGG